MRGFNLSFDNFSFWLRRLLALADIPGGVVAGLFSLELLAVIPWCLLNGVAIPATLRDIYLGVIGAFATTNVARHYMNSKNGGSNETKG
jgi:hypothetical protein